MEAQYSVEREYGTTSTKCVWHVSVNIKRKFHRMLHSQLSYWITSTNAYSQLYISWLSVGMVEPHLKMCM